MDSYSNLKRCVDNESGMTLFMTVLFLSMLSLLILSLMQTLLLYTKAHAHLIVQHHALYRLETTLHVLMDHLNDPKETACYLHTHDPNRMMEALKNQQGCPYDTGQESLRYLFADLGVEPCLRIIRDQLSQSTHHWLIGVYHPSLGGIQIRIAREAKEGFCPTAEPQIIEEGIISWRYLA